MVFRLTWWEIGILIGKITNDRKIWSTYYKCNIEQGEDVVILEEGVIYNEKI